MNKTGQMIEFEEETGGYAIVTVKVGFAELQFPSEVYVEWLEAELLKASVKADAYDRLMSGGKKTLKEWANIFGKPVVDSDGTILVFSSVPSYEGGYSQEGEFVDEWVGNVVAHIDCEYEGEYAEITLPDGWDG